VLGCWIHFALRMSRCAFCKGYTDKLKTQLPSAYIIRGGTVKIFHPSFAPILALPTEEVQSGERPSQGYDWDLFI